MTHIDHYVAINENYEILVWTDNITLRLTMTDMEALHPSGEYEITLRSEVSVPSRVDEFVSIARRLTAEPIGNLHAIFQEELDRKCGVVIEFPHYINNYWSGPYD